VAVVVIGLPLGQAWPHREPRYDRGLHESTYSVMIIGWPDAYR
jgi:hypothetical protein